MKNIMHRTSLIIALFFFTLTLTAQERSPENGAKLITDTMKSKLSLNDSQYEKAYTANLEFLNAARTLKESGERRMDKAKKLRALGEERDAKMKAMLSEEQYKQYLLIKEENKDKIRERRTAEH